MIEECNPRSALRARIRIAGEGRDCGSWPVRVIEIFVWHRRQCLHCWRAGFDSRSPLRARIRMAGGLVKRVGVECLGLITRGEPVAWGRIDAERV
jgi:hypothetical protein